MSEEEDSKKEEVRVAVPRTTDAEEWPSYIISTPTEIYRPMTSNETTFVTSTSVSLMNGENTNDETGIIGNGDVPQFGHIPELVTPGESGSVRSNDSMALWAEEVKKEEEEEGTGITKAKFKENVTLASISGKVADPTFASADLNATLEGYLGQAKGGAWKEKATTLNLSGVNGGAKIDNLHIWCKLDPEKGWPWCASFVSWALDQAGIASMRTASSQAWRGYGIEVGVGDWSKVRWNDLVIFSYGGGTGHIGFYRGYNQTTRRINILGGNQGNDLNIKSFGIGKVTSIKRNWIPFSDVETYIEEDAPKGGGYEDTR